MNRTAEPEDRSARFEALFRREYPSVVAYLSRRAEPDVVDDLVDEVFLVAWRRLDRVPEEPLPWLLTVARNVLGTHIRGARRSRALTLRLATSEVDWTSPPPGLTSGEAAAALAGLALKDQEALMLVGWDGLSPREAALALGERPASFRMRLHRARVRFRRALEQSTDDAGATESRRDNDILKIAKEVPHVQNP